MRNKKATTRSSRLKQKQRKEIKKNAIYILKAILKGIGYFFIGCLYIIKETYAAFEKSFLKVWKKLPKWVIRIIIWTMIFNIILLNDKAPEIIETIKTEIKIKEIYTIKEIMIEPEKCAYGIYECAIYDAAIEYGLSEEQARISIAVAQHETGDFKSVLFKNNNNPAGLWNGKAQKFYSFDTVEDGIDCYIKNVGYYFNNGYETIEKLQKKWAPLNAKNDPTGINNNWISGVTYYYNQL